MNNECSRAVEITALACKLMNCMSIEELTLLSVDLIQLADTLDAMIARKEICESTTKP